MSVSTRRRFLGQSILAAAGLCASRLRMFAARPGKNALLDGSAVQRLASAISGRVITPDASEYESARLVFNRAFDLHPAMIVRCANATDVARTLEFAQTSRLPVAVRSGGHSRAGFSACDGGVVIDLSPMKRVDVDASRRVARAGAGSLVGDMDAATMRFGLATPSGGCPNVGMAGFTLGGGEGLLMTMHGAGCDNLLTAHVVLVDGKEVETSLESNPDLFWAIRGGGGNFGVVTGFEYRLHPVGNVLAGALTYPPGRIAELLNGFAKFNASVPDEMVPLGELLPAEQGPRFINHICYFGDARTGNDLLRPLRTPLKPEHDDLRMMSYFDAQAAGFRPAPFAHFQSNVFLPKMSEAAVDVITTAVNNAPRQFRVLMVGFVGAITRVGANETAFALRQPGVEIDILGSWSTAAEKTDAVQWVKALRDSLRPFAHGVYVSQLGETSDELVRAAYASNYGRLAQIKRKYDPNNVLHRNQNIKPA